MEPPFIVDLVDEAGKIRGDIVEGLIFGDVGRIASEANVRNWRWSQRVDATL